MKERELVCIICPRGCRLKVEISDGKAAQEIRISGNSCPRGEEYGKKEVIHPTRTVTSTVRVEGGRRHLVPVKTLKEIRRKKFSTVWKRSADCQLKAPVCIGQILLEDIAGTGIPLVTSGNVDAVRE